MNSLAQMSQIDLNVPNQQDRDQKPWKYIGYSEFCIFVSGDSDRLALRRFDELHARVLLGMQDELSESEEKLKLLDAGYSAKHGPDYLNGSIRKDLPDRKNLLKTIRTKLDDYVYSITDRMILQYSQLRLWPPAAKQTIKVLTNWLYNNKGPIVENETRFLGLDDLISVPVLTKSALRQFVDPWVAGHTKGLLSIFKNQADAETGSINEATVSTSDDQKVDKFCDIVIFVVGLALLIAPMWVLQALSSIKWKLGVISLFIMILFLVVSIAFVGKPFQVLAATAAYAAVLVVFLQPLHNTAS